MGCSGNKRSTIFGVKRNILLLFLQGLDFLGIACDSEITCHLTDEEFTKLKESIGQCVCHIVGSLDQKHLKVASPATVSRRLSRLASKLHSNVCQAFGFMFHSFSNANSFTHKSFRNVHTFRKPETVAKGIKQYDQGRQLILEEFDLQRRFKRVFYRSE